MELQRYNEPFAEYAHNGWHAVMPEMPVSGNYYDSKMIYDPHQKTLSLFQAISQRDENGESIRTLVKWVWNGSYWICRNRNLLSDFNNWSICYSHTEKECFIWIQRSLSIGFVRISDPHSFTNVVTVTEDEYLCSL